MASKTFKATAISTGVAIALGTAPQAFAQDDERIEEITVTGSHIRRTEYEGSSPIQIVDAQTIAGLGVNQPIEILKDLTVNSGSQYYNETNSVAGSAMFNIRNLGLGSTLTLLNGRRAGVAAVADASGTDFLDINQFPIAMIERIEVLTDGASALYGSQAVSGVANIITRKGFEGFEISGGLSSSEIDTYDINIAAGSQFADDKGGFNIYATFYTQDLQDRSDFDWMHTRLIGDDVNGDASQSRFVSSTGSPGSYRLATIGANGEATDVAGAFNHPDADCLAAGGILRSPTDNTCRYNFVDQVSVISAEDRIQVFTEFDWKFNDKLTYFAEASFSRNTIRRNDGGGTFNTGQATGGGFTVPADHPFNFWTADPATPGGMIWVDPASWDPLVDVAVPVRAIARPFGIDVNHNEKTEQIRRQLEYIRFMNGVEYSFDNGWYVNGSFSYASGTRNTVGGHNYRSDIFQLLVKDGEWNPFGTRLADPTLVSPKDGFSVAGNSPITQEKFDQHSISSSRTSEVVLDLVASGELFTFGDNTVNAAFGAQFRDVAITIIPDSLSSAGESSETSIENYISGSTDVTAIFAEVIVPFGDQVEVQLALRQEDYGGNIGSTTDPKVSFQFQPTDWLGFRGSFGTSFQAPTVRQTASATASAFINDPASPTGPNGSLVCFNNGIQNNISVNVVGSPGLKPQSADNYNFGVVFQNEGGFRAGLDYWNFDYTDLIAAGLSPQAVVDNDCLDDGIPNSPAVIRDAGGQLRQVNQEFINVGKVQTDGFDLNADYTMDVGNSTLIFDLSATQVLNFDVDKQNGDPVFDGAGSRNASNNFSTMPELRGHIGATWLMGDHSASVTARYIDSYGNDQSSPAFPAQVDNWTTFDAQYSILLPGLIGDGDTRLSVGVNNITDEDPPALYRNNNLGVPIPKGNTLQNIDRPGYDDRAGHDIRGRIVYARFVHNF